MPSDDDIASTPRDGGTLPLVHTIAEDGTVRLRRLPRGASIHKPLRGDRRRAPALDAVPLTPVVLVDSTPGGTTPGAIVTASVDMKTKPSVVPSSDHQSTLSSALPSGKTEEPAVVVVSFVRIVILAAATGALFASVVLIGAYLLFVHGR